jgi:archaemetzincin
MVITMDNQAGGAVALAVEVIPLGRVNQTAVAVAAGNVQTLLGLDTLVMPPWPEPDYALMPTRGQYDAGIILARLAQDAPAPRLRLGLTSHDLCLSFVSHVYGQAQLGGRAAVVSLHRLQFFGQSGGAPHFLALERLAKITLHEMAHLLALTHCRTPGCVMGAVTGLEELDRMILDPCPACEARIVSRIRLLGEAARRAPG